MAEHEVCNQQFDKCPGCGQYKGQYHNSECPCLKKEQNDHLGVLASQCLGGYERHGGATLHCVALRLAMPPSRALCGELLRQ